MNTSNTVYPPVGHAQERATGVGAPARRIAHRTRGSTHGPVTRLMSPSDLGHLLKPFVFLDIFELASGARMSTFPLHPHSGIATLTYLLEGQAAYEDTTGEHGKRGLLPAGGVEWMQAGGGVWHTAGPASRAATRGFQLWVALPPALENAPAESIYLEPGELPQHGPAVVLLGTYQGVSSPVPAPSAMTYLAVNLKSGQRWRYEPPAGHTVAWVAVGQGQLNCGAGTPIAEAEIAAFEESSRAIDFQATQDTSFVLGSAAKHPHDLVMGMYSVHTSHEALAIGEEGIRQVAKRIRLGQPPL